MFWRNARCLRVGWDGGLMTARSGSGAAVLSGSRTLPAERLRSRSAGTLRFEKRQFGLSTPTNAFPIPGRSVSPARWSRTVAA